MVSLVEGGDRKKLGGDKKVGGVGGGVMKRLWIYLCPWLFMGGDLDFEIC